MNRINRLTAILIHLQTKRVVKAQELADRFSISLRTIYRDVRALEEAGVPIGAEAGIGYFLEDYHLPPVMLTNAEASALVFGAKLMERLADESLREPFASALYKIKSVLKRTEKEHLNDLEAQVAVSPSGAVSAFASPVLNTIQAALVGQRVLAMTYRAAYTDETAQREVEPVGVILYGGGWHLIAWCRLRQDYRDFRTDRILDIQETNKTFSRQNRLTLQAYLQQLRDRGTELQEVVVWFEKNTARFTERQRYTYGFVSEETSDDQVRMQFMTPSLEGLGRWLMMYGNAVTIESPDQLKENVRAYAQELQAHYLPTLLT
jgi:predicted DNA-binding transcriptional regulator YafY